MKLDHPELQSRLAAEYVLGTMHGGARRRFDEYLRHHRGLQAAVARWEAHLTPLAEQIAPINPPSRVWRRIEARINGKIPGNKSPLSTGNLGQNGARSPVLGGLFQSLFFWRGLGMGASTLAMGLLVSIFVGNVMPTHDPMMTAVLEDQGVARMVVEQPKSGMLMVKMVKPWKTAPSNSLQLWVMPKDGPPRSIGIINQDGSTKINMQDLDGMLNDGLAFALSKEPMGGSPTGLPTGMILCKGVIAKMPPKQAPKQQI